MSQTLLWFSKLNKYCSDTLILKTCDFRVFRLILFSVSAETKPFVAGAHTRDTTPAALSKLVQPYIAACVQRQYLSNWLRTVTTAAGSSSCVEKLPEQVLMPGGALCPTITAFVAAVGQQMDIVDAAVHEIEVRAAVILFSKSICLYFCII